VCTLCLSQLEGPFGHPVSYPCPRLPFYFCCFSTAGLSTHVSAVWQCLIYIHPVAVLCLQLSAVMTIEACLQYWRPAERTFVPVLH
jgi:hypothetical protein